MAIPGVNFDELYTNPEQPQGDAVEAGLDATRAALPPSAPAPASKGPVFDPHTMSTLESLYAEEAPKPVAKGRVPQPGGYEDNRRAVESGNEEDYWSTLGPVLNIPRKDKVAALQKYLETPSVNISGLKEAPLASAYALTKAAEKEGLAVVFQSGARHGGGGSYHDHGEAVDVRFQRVLKDGTRLELTPRENVEAGKRLGKAAGWASALDEFHYWSDGRAKNDPWNNAPHVHLAYGNERGLDKHPMHHQLNRRHHTDPDYLSQAPHLGHELSKKAPAREDRKNIPGLVEVIAHANGIDGDVAVNWVNAESSFNPKAVSPAGAMGLTQMMPGTLKEVAAKVGITEEEFHNSPAAQIKAGVYYLKQQLKANNGNYARALAAYNAGPGGLQDIIKGANIPETADYVYKILKESDPTITSPEAALEAIRSGKGRVRDVEADKQVVKDTLYNAKRETSDIWYDMMGETTPGDVAKSSVDLSNPVSATRKSFQFLNEMLNDASFGLIPLTKAAKESQAEGDALLWGEGGSVNPLNPVAWAQAGTTYGIGLSRILAGSLTGGILARGARMLPVVGKIIAGGEAAAAAGKMVGATGGAIAEGGGIMSTMGKLVSGGPLDIFKANLAEQVSTGVIAGSVYGASNYFWDNQDGATGTDFLREMVSHGMLGGYHGGIMGAGLALGLPIIGGGLLTTANRLTGLGSANMADNAVTALGRQFGELGSVQRTLAGAAGGATVGALGGAAADVTGLSQFVTGEDAGLLNSSLTGAKYMAGIGAVSGLGYKGAMGVLDKAANSAFMKSPRAQALLAPIKEFVAKQNDQVVRIMAQEQIDDMNKYLSHMKQSQTHANAVVHLGNVKDRVTGLDELYKNQMQTTHKAQAMVQDLEQQLPQIEKMGMELSAKYPHAYAHEFATVQTQTQLAGLMEVVSKRGAKGPTKAQQTQIASLQAKLQDLSTAGGSKELKAELSLFKADEERLKLRKQKVMEQHAKAKEALEQEATAASGIEMVKEVHAQRQAQLEDLLAKGASAEELLNTQYSLKLEGPWNKPGAYKDARSILVDPKAEAASQEMLLSDILSRQSREAMRTGKEAAAHQELELSQALRAKAKDPEEFKGTLQRRLEDIKGQVKSLEEAKPKGPDVMSKAAWKKWKKENHSLTDWMEDTPFGASVGVADAQAIRAAALARLEKSGAGVDRSVMFAEAGKEAQKKFISRKQAFPGFDSTDASLLSLATEAEAQIRLGETRMPVAVTKENLKAFQELVKEGEELGLQAAKKEAAEELTRLERSFAGMDPQGFVKPLMGGPKDSPVPVEGVEGMAEAAILDDVYRMDESWSSVPKRLSHLEKDVRGKLGVMGDVESYNAFIESGNISHLPEEVADFVKSGGDLETAPPAVKAWSEAVTMARTEEIKRLRRMEGLIIGKEDDALVLSSIREARAAGYEPPEFGGRPKECLAEMQGVLGNDSNSINLVNKAWAELISADSPPVWQKIFPLAQSFYHDHIYSRLAALDIMKGRMMKPTYTTIDEKFVAAKKAKGVDWTPEAKTKFEREFVDAVQDTGLLKKFKEDHPEADELVNFYYGVQRHMESVAAASPKLAPWIQANYLPMRFRKMAAHAKVAQDGERISMAAAIARGDLAKKFKTLKEVDDAVESITKEVTDAGFYSADEFINMGQTERAKRFKFGKTADMDKEWADLSDPAKQGVIKEVEGKLMTLLMQDPVLNPLELLDIQMSSVFRADSQRQFLDGLSRMPAVVDERGATLKMVEPVRNPGHSYKVKGPKSNEDYSRLDSIPGFHGVSLDIEGKAYKAHELQVHPEVFRFLKDFSMGQGYSEVGWERNLQRMQSIFRNTVLMGTFIPHQLQTLSSHMMEFVRSPFKMMKLSVAGSNLGGGNEMSQAALMANAVRNGLNVRTLERSASFMAKGVLDEWGPEVTGRLYGVEDHSFGRFLQALDPGDPMNMEARSSLPGIAQKAVDVLGLPAHMDYAMNREMLFRPIEMGQLAGFHMRAQRYLVDHAKDMEHLSDPEKMRMAMRLAADQTNRLAGALPHIFQNNKARQAAHSLLLTPTWFMSKAYTIADSIDGLIYLGTKKAGGKGFSLAEMAGRRPFDYLPESMRDATRARMGKTIMAGLIGSVAMTEAAQYFADGTSIYDHPPDKFMHIKIGDEFYTGPVYGYVRDVLRFGTAAASEDGYSGSPSSTSFYEATVEALTRQLNPSLEAMTQFLFKTRKGEVLEAPDSIATFLEGVAGTAGKSALETLGVDSKQFKLKNVPGYLGAGDAEQKAGAEASMLKARHYLLRQAGAYSSPDNTDMRIHGHFYDRNKDLERRHRSLIQPLLRKARGADTGEEQGRWLSEAYDKYYSGIPVRDKALRDYYPEGVYRLSDKEFESMVLEEFNPGAKASQASGVVGMMVATARAQAGRL